jgi:hypothetical protein
MRSTRSSNRATSSARSTATPTIVVGSCHSTGASGRAAPWGPCASTSSAGRRDDRCARRRGRPSRDRGRAGARTELRRRGFRARFEPCAHRLVVRRKAEVVDDARDVQPRPADEDGIAPRAKISRWRHARHPDTRRRRPRRRPRARRRDGAGCRGARRGKLRRADVHAAVQLHRVGVDDLGGRPRVASARRAGARGRSCPCRSRRRPPRASAAGGPRRLGRSPHVGGRRPDAEADRAASVCRERPAGGTPQDSACVRSQASPARVRRMRSGAPSGLSASRWKGRRD